MVRTKPLKPIPTNLFYILTEGEKTEPNYFRSPAFRNARAFPKINPGKCPGNDAQSLKFWAQDVMKGDFRDGDKLWIVLDRDENEVDRLFGLTEWCKSNGVGLAFSNPCFELWLLMHFIYIESAMNKEDLNRKLTDSMEEPYDKRKDYSAILHDRIDTAVKNAANARKNGIPGRRCDQNPFTNVDMLIDDLRRFLENRG